MCTMKLKRYTNKENIFSKSAIHVKFVCSLPRVAFTDFPCDLGIHPHNIWSANFPYVYILQVRAR